MKERYKSMKAALSLLAVLTLPAPSPAQGYVQYTYDNAGNRTGQSWLTEGEDRLAAPFGLTDRQTGGTTINGQVGGHIVRAVIQSGLLRVEVLGLRAGDRCHLAVCSLGGQVLISMEAADTSTTLDLSGYANGVYMLCVRINEESDSWKITM